jgi:peptidoglycan-associated lipoprotein
MNFGVKLGVAASALLLLAACENPGGSDAGGAGGAGGAGAATPGTNEDFSQNVGDRVFFELDSSTLSSDAQATLDRQASWLKQYGDVKIVVEGHCDERGTREYNLALGERRANAARKYLIGKGVEASRVSTVSYGKERPANTGSGEASWAENRRSVTVLAR